MDINGREKAKRFWIVVGLLGICMFVTAIFCFFHTEKNEAEKRMVEIVNYVKVQCSTYTHYNESSESKSLLRAIESARQMSTNIDMEVKNRKQLDRKLLKENLQSLWVDGILVLDEEGKKVAEHDAAVRLFRVCHAAERPRLRGAGLSAIAPERGGREPRLWAGRHRPRL